MLGHVKSNLRATVVADQQRRAEQLAAERTLAPPTTSSPSPSLDAPTGPTLPTQLPVAPPIVTVPAPRPSSPGSYANPLRAVGALSPERIDQGVDYSGFGPIYAIGDGVVLSTGGDWPGGTFIAYRLTDGPAQGLVVYAAEDIVPNVQVGAKVTANTVLGQVYAGPTGIESGWADGSALGNTMARTYGQYNGSNSTAFGANFSRLLRALGAPPGTLQGQPTGVLPAGWPTW
jgi:murein DD-endopeptidase MepM/ murein hydrolase activator NlpD